MATNNTSGRKDTRDSLLNELESIRSLLKEHSEDNQPHLSTYGNDDNAGIPILNDAIPVLNDRIPLLETPVPSKPVAPTKAADPQMASVRAAAAMIAAKAVRNRDTEAPPVAEKPAEPGQVRRDNEQLIAAVIEELRPQLESLLRNTLRKHLTAQGNNPKGNP